ncbi:MAG: hypothetical protein AAF587_19645 [Bacteroidota bacterium]
MNLVKKITLFLLGFFMLVIFGCQDDNPPSAQNDQEFRCLINGQVFNGVHFNNSLIFSKNGLSGDWAKRMDIRAENDARDSMVILTFGLEPAMDSTDACLPLALDIVEESFGSTNSFCTLTVGNVLDGFPVSGFTRLSRCDSGDLLMDGVFENISKSLINSDTIRFTNGVFNNIEFTIIQ